MNKNKVMDFFSALGRSLLMPIAALAACGIVLGLSSALMKAQVVEALPFLQLPVLQFVILTLNKVAGVVFTLIPVLFSISIAFGLAKEEKEIAAFAGFIGYYTFLVASSCMIGSGFMDFGALKISAILGVETLDMGAVAGIISGLVTAKIHNKYHKVQFPVAISFYGGKRFVAIAVIMAMAAAGLIAPLVWKPISAAIDGLGGLISATGLAGVFTYGFLERLLIPTGLHHVLNGLFRTTSLGGVYEGVEGCLNIFLQFIDKVDISELKPFTVFLGQGKMPMMMFGLPAAALAMYHTAKDTKKKAAAGLLMSVAVASFFNGVTEPLEFSFMFLAPALYGVHAVLTGISMAVVAALPVRAGFNFSAGLVDWILSFKAPFAQNPLLLIPIGLVVGAVYYVVFRFVIVKFNMKTPGREDDNIDETKVELANNDFTGIAKIVLEGVGGPANVTSIDNCITRLRLEIKDYTLIDEHKIKSAGVAGVIRPSKTAVQVIIGTKVQFVADEFKKLCK